MATFYSNIHNNISNQSVHFFHTPHPLASKLPFSILACGHYFCLPGYKVERRGLHNHLLVYTLKGSGKIRYRDVQSFIKPGQAFFIDCDEQQEYEATEEGWEIQWVRFEMLSGVDYHEAINGERFSVITSRKPVEVNDQLELIIRQAQLLAPTADFLMAEALCSLLTGLYIDKYCTDTLKLSPSAVVTVAEAVAYLDQHYTNAVSVGELANNCHMTPYALIRLFKRQTGLTPYEYALNLRIVKARQLLVHTDLPVGLISDQVGFNNVNNFIRKFKKMTNLTPLQYRNLNQER